MDFAYDLSNLEIANMQRAIELIHICIEVIKKFDGKVVNKRLETALANATGETIIVNKGGIRPIDFYTKNRYVQGENFTTAYISYPTYCLIGVCRDFINEDGRLNGESAVNAMLEQATYYEEQIQRYKDAIEHIEEYKAHMQHLKDEINETKKKIPASMQKYFNIS